MGFLKLIMRLVFLSVNLSMLCFMFIQHVIFFCVFSLTILAFLTLCCVCSAFSLTTMLRSECFFGCKNKRCLEKEQVQPPENPILCHHNDKRNHSFVIACCKDADHCNRHLHPTLERPKPPGKASLWSWRWSSSFGLSYLR